MTISYTLGSRHRSFLLPQAIALGILIALVGCDRAPTAPAITPVAESDETNALVDKGNTYLLGKGVPKDYSEAMRLYRLAAEKGSPRGMGGVGALYRQGHGVPKDLQEAAKWTLMSAEKGSVSAMFSIAIHYHGGDGVAQDYKEAMKWFRAAAERGHGSAMNSLGGYYADGKVGESDKAFALKWFRLSAEKGVPVAMLNLGSMYAYGEGVPKDLQEARNWYQRAEEIEPGVAKERLAELDRLDRQRALKSANALEAALMIGISTKENFQHFVDQGGLDFESSWRGFKATGYGAIFKTSKGHVPAQLVETGEPARASGFTVRLYKSFGDSKLASINNLKEALSAECGTWSPSDQVLGQWMRQQEDRCCLIAEQGIQVTVSVQPAISPCSLR